LIIISIYYDPLYLPLMRGRILILTNPTPSKISKHRAGPVRKFGDLASSKTTIC